MNRDDASLLEWAWGVAPADARRADPERFGRLSDLIRPECVGRAFREARSAPEDVSGEAARVELRLLVAPYLAVAAEEATEGRRGDPPEDHRSAWLDTAAFDSDRAARAAAVRRLREGADRLHDGARRLGGVLDDAARRAGAANLLELQSATVPRETSDLLENVERGGLVPLDAAVARGAHERWLRSPWRDRDAPAAAEEDIPYLERLGDRASLLPARAVRDVLSGIAGAFARAGAVSWSRGGPGGLLEGLSALGRALRSEARADCRARLGGDPAFSWATAELFARIGTRDRGLERWLPPLDESARRDRSFEAALIPRVAWAVAGAEPAGSDGERRRLERATSRPASPVRLLAVGAIPEEPTARIRGVLLAVLLEERALTRHGYRFWEARDSRRLLGELWASEADETPRSVASALGLGTMDASPLADACRP